MTLLETTLKDIRHARVPCQRSAQNINDDVLDTDYWWIVFFRKPMDIIFSYGKFVLHERRQDDDSTRHDGKGFFKTNSRAW